MQLGFLLKIATVTDKKKLNHYELFCIKNRSSQLRQIQCSLFYYCTTADDILALQVWWIQTSTDQTRQKRL